MTHSSPDSKISEASYFQSQMHFDDSVESIADSDLEDRELQKMLTSPLYAQKVLEKPDAMVVQEGEREWFGEHVLHPTLRQILWCVDSSLMEPCRYDMGCWRPLCPYRHSGRRASRWAALWSHLTEEEDQIVDVPVPQIMEDAAEIIPKAHISERKFIEAFDVPAPQIQEEIVEVSQFPPQERTSERKC